MDRITDITINNNIITAIFHTEKAAEANMLRHAILNEIETYAIDIVIFDTNTSPRHDEIIAFRLGQLVIDNTKFIPPKEGDFRTNVTFSGPGELTTEHIKDIPFKYETPIITLREGQKLDFDIIVKKDISRTHAKWRPVATVAFKKLEKGYLFRLKDIGMMNPNDIFAQGLNKIQLAASREAPNFFFKTVAI